MADTFASGRFSTFKGTSIGIFKTDKLRKLVSVFEELDDLLFIINSGNNNTNSHLSVLYTIRQLLQRKHLAMGGEEELPFNRKRHLREQEWGKSRPLMLHLSASVIMWSIGRKSSCPQKHTGFEPPFISLYFTRKMGNGWSDLLKHTWKYNIQGKSRVYNSIKPESQYPVWLTFILQQRRKTISQALLIFL